MPLVKRAVEPVFISRAVLSSEVKNELEGVVVNTLAGLIRQLSGVSKHAENLFGDLVSEANGIYLRTVSLSGRVLGLQDRICQLDAGGKEDARNEDFNMKAFKSTSKEEQAILDRGTLPTALQEVYRSCDAPPSLRNFTPYRDDGKDGLKFYTDPTYFFELWVQEQTKQIEKKQKKKAKGGRKKKESKKKKVKAVQKKQYAGVDREFLEHSAMREAPGEIVIPGTPPVKRASTEVFTSDIPPAVPPPPHQSLSQAQMAAPTAPPPPPPPVPPSANAMGAMGVPPPPPPPPPGPGFHPPPPVPPPQMEGTPKMNHYPNTNFPQAPPVPPPPAPPANLPAPPPPPPAPIIKGDGMSPPPPPMPSEPGVVGEIKKPVVEEDKRSALLMAIEKGKHLRKVEKKDHSKPSATYGNDVASILKRRIAFEVSDTESDEDESEEEDSDWSN